MKVIIVLCGFIALTCGEIGSSNKYGTHYSQHEQSVTAAKQSLQDRLSQLEAQNGNTRTGSSTQSRYGNAYSASGSEKYVGQCAWCGGSENRETYSSRLASESQRRSSSSNYGSTQGYSGTGVVGFSEDDQDVQSHVDPWSSGTSSRFSSNAHEADDMQQRIAAGDSSSAYRSHLSEDNEDDLQRTVGPTATRTNTYGRESSSDLYRTTARDQSYGSNSQRSSVSLSDLNEPSSRPVPTGQYVSMGVRPGTTTVLRVPVRVIDVQGVPEDNQQRVYSTASERSSNSESSSSRVQQQQLPSSATYRVTYTPTYVNSGRTSTSRDSETQRTVSGDTQRVIVGDPQRPPQPEKFTNYNNFNLNNPESASQTRHRTESRNSEDSQVRVAPIDVSGPTYGGSSRFATTGSQGTQSGYTQSRVPVYSANNVESSSSSRTAEEREQRRYNSPAPTYVTANRFAGTESETNRNTQAGGASTTYYVPSATRTQSQHQSGSGAQTQYQSTQQQQRPGHYSPYAPARSQSGASQAATSGSDSTNFLSSRSGSGVLPSGTSTDDLRYYMSESERLARLQQQQIAGSSSSNAAASNAEANRRTIINASNLDSAAASFVGRTNLGSRTSELDTDDEAASGTGNGYNRVRSWNKQSSWSSGSQYGPDGKPKTYSTLSTAEAEKHNINGAETGYKAATTTLENDGKVSTYSIHTP